MSSASLIPRKKSPFSHEVLFLLLLDWLDIRSLRTLDTAITDNVCGGGESNDCISNEDTKLTWLQCLKTVINLRALVTMEYDHSWIRWLILRGVKTSRIHVKQASVREISDATFKDIEMSTLRSINLSFCKEISVATIRAFSVGCPNITNVTLVNCSGITDASMTILKDQFVELLEVDIENCKRVTDAGVSELTKCKSLTSLRLAYNCNLTESAFTILGSTSHGMKVIDLDGCSKISDNGIALICKGCPLLESISISYCRLLTTTGVEAIAKCKHLTSIKLRNNYAIGDSGIIALAEGCHQIKLLHIQECGNITDRSLTAIGKNLRGLEDISLGPDKSYNNDRLTDAGVRALMYGCPKLQTIVIDGREGVTDDVLGPLGLACPGLTNLDISKCKKVSAIGVTNLLQTCSSIKNIRFNYCSPTAFLGLFSLQMEYPHINFTYKASIPN